MKFILPLLLLVCTNVLAQKTAISLFQPIEEAARFTTENSLNKHITQYTLLQPDQTVWSNLLAERPQSLTLTLPFEGGLTLELEKTNPLAHDFILTASNAAGGTDTLDYQPGLHYSGKIAGEVHSLVAISIFEDQIMGVISDANSNINLGRVNTDAAWVPNVYVMFREVDLVNPPKMECGTSDKGEIEIPVDYAKPSELVENNLPVNACPIRIFLDCDFGLYLFNGSNTSATMNMATANFNVSKTIFANENVGVEISEVHVWTGNDPFVNNNKDTALWYFRGYYNPIGINGNIALLLQPDNLGGIAWLDKICNPWWHYGVVGNMTYPAPYPNWTFSVKAMTHELGHSFGSAHTQYCGWPGGAIDNCYATEPTCQGCPPCPPGPPPVNGGTIMSYCEQNPPFSVPLSNGFGPMPGWVIRDRAMNAPCLKVLNDEYNQPTVCGCTPDPADVQELINFYNTTGGANWTNKTNWGNFNDYNWYGVRWIKVGSKCKVVYLDLANNNLNGIIPNISLSNLKTLYLGLNQINGHIPDFNFPNLEIIGLSDNYLTGTIPNFNFPKLKGISLGFNQLNGTIPNFNFPLIKTFDLRDNQLSGSIPNFNFPLVYTFSVGQNNLSGNLPNFVMPEVVNFVVSNNKFSGNIPLLEFPKVANIYLDNNLFSGEIPIFNTPNVTYLRADNNLLIGQVPNYSYPKLEILYLFYNQFTGVLPNLNLPKLRHLYLDNNQLSGNIPNFNTPLLESLELKFNKFSGPIPPFNYPKLTYLGLNINELSGAVPNLMLPLIQALYLNFNKLNFSGLYQFFPNNIPYFTISPQKNISIFTTQNCNSLYVRAGGVTAHNTYKWYKVGTGLVATTVGDSLYTPTSAGQYYCEVSNSVVTGLTLTSETVQNGSAYVAIAGTTSFCFGGNTVLDAGSGYASYIWSNGATTQQITASSGGNYSVTVSVAPGCTGTAQTTVTSVAYPQPSISSSAPAICTGITSASLNAGSGYGAYLWSNGETTQNIDVSQPGTYTVTVTNTPGCSGTATYTLNALAAANPVVSGIAPICPGQNLTLSVGSFAAYNWSSGGTTSSITVNQPGTYTVTVTNAAGCTGTGNAVVPNNPLNVSIQGSQQICTGGFTVLDAGSGYNTYTWSNGTTTRINEVAASGLFIVTVTNVQGCTGTATLEVVEVPLPAPFPDIQGLTTVCGSTSTSLNAGSSYASYTWSTGSTAQSINVNQSGTYSVTVTDASGCKGKDDATVTFGTTPMPQISGVSALCNGLTATLTANAGFQSYLWNTGGMEGSISISQAGTYTVTVTDNNGCTGTTTASISSAAAPTASIGSTVSPCIGQPNGSATVMASAGVPPYTYAWSNGQTGTTANNLVPGNYFVTVTDSNGCSTTATVFISSAAAPTVNIGSTVSPCIGQPNGGATVIANGGVPPYIYAWSNGQTGADANNLVAGNYFVTVTDSNGCSTTAPVFISSAAAPTVNIGSTVSPCIGQPNGSAEVIANGGVPPYIYAWSNGQTGADANNLVAGNYFVTVTDSNGCSTTATVFISSAATPTVNIGSTVSPCIGQPNGSATVIANGGVPPYTYVWSTGQTGATANNLVAGNYTVTVSGNNGCTSIYSTELTETSVFTIDLQTNLEAGGLTCQSTANTMLGTPPFIYNWSNGQNEQTASNLSSGQFSVTVTDATGCTSVQTGSCLPVSTNDIDGLQAFSVRPNPASTNLLVHIRLTNQEHLRIRLFNAIGQNLFEAMHYADEIEENIDLIGIPSGCYLLQVSTQSSSKSELISIVR